MTMRNVGVAAIIVGILAIILIVAGVIGQGSMRTSLLAAIVMIVVGVFLYGGSSSKP
jgi:hypothetical protein